MTDRAAVTMVRNELEIERLRAELSDEFHLSPETVETGLRAEFERRAQYPVQDFVPIFVKCSLRGKLRQTP
jgi:hypothetical protein